MSWGARQAYDALARRAAELHDVYLAHQETAYRAQRHAEDSARRAADAYTDYRDARNKAAAAFDALNEAAQ
ncbi:hypothetical protein [Deinococcus humi]|uniref:Uncharacterized protein n=1 Tax=Deinococcus humi TaxID=662880 RepID=A0A7W8ND88_9DEIO|nr:hypothetical protein [Deinococcus humi]MBB5361380.1 hypothetical protein [Deinococcus humi]GGO19790.1 hypothetical protein GCM10008949_04430 [Deinococcus humi]